jgi:hypothetical protein
MEFCKIKGGFMKSIKLLIWIFLTLAVVCLLFCFAVNSKYEADLDFRFSYADENAQIENERMTQQVNSSVGKFLTKVSLQRTLMRFIEKNVEYSNLKEVVSNAVLGCKIKCVDRNNHVYRFEIVAPSKKLSEKIVKFVFLTCQKSLEDRRAIVFQKNAGRIEDMQKREELRKLINKDSLKIEMLGDVRIRKIW